MTKHLLVSAALMFAVASCKKEPVDTKKYTVSYGINCNECDVFYTADQTGTQQSQYKKSTGWSFSFEAKPSQEILFLAYNNTSNPQAVTATIYLNGNVLETRTTYCPISGYAFCVDTLE